MIFGNDFYKECIARAEARAHALGPVLGPTIPSSPTMCAAVRDFRARRGLVPHVAPKR